MGEANTREREKPESLICPEGHSVPYAGWNYARDDSDSQKDADGTPTFEPGLFCYECRRPYGLSKLSNPEKAAELQTA